MEKEIIAVNEINKAMHSKFHYGPTPLPGSFGYETTKNVIMNIEVMLREIMPQLSILAHESWGEVVKAFKDPSYEFDPHKLDRRLKLSNTEYDKLSEEDQYKDLYIVYKVIEEFIKKQESVKVIVKHPKSGNDVLFDFYYADPTILEFSYRLGEFESKAFALDYLNRVCYLIEEEGHYYEGTEI